MGCLLLLFGCQSEILIAQQTVRRFVFFDLREAADRRDEAVVGVVVAALADLAEQHSGEDDPVFLYAVETALQIHIAELTEPLRELYVMAYSLPSIAAYLYKSTTKRLQVIFGPYLPEAQPKDFYEMEIASASIMRGFMSVPCDVYFTMEAKISRFLDCSLKLYDVPKEKRAAITAAVLQMDLHTMASGIIQKTVQQAEKGFEALTEKQI